VPVVSRRSEACARAGLYRGDDNGWTVQSDNINLADAQVTVTAGGTNVPVTVMELQGGYGSRYAFRFNPMGWDTAAGQTYAVSVTG
jgi:hypothetical protein